MSNLSEKSLMILEAGIPKIQLEKIFVAHGELAGLESGEY